jgi:hypothetical protein
VSSAPWLGAAYIEAQSAQNTPSPTAHPRGVQLIEVQSDADATVHIDIFRDCRDRDLLGYAQNRAGFPDWIGVNTCALDERSGQVREHVLTRELGHHLGSGHQPPRLCGKSIMLEHVPCGRECIVPTEPGSRDVRWYRERWVRKRVLTQARGR